MKRRVSISEQTEVLIAAVFVMSNFGINRIKMREGLIAYCLTSL